MAISSVTVAELLFGAENSSSPAENKRIVDGFVQRLHVLDFDQAAATQYAQIRIELKRKSIGAYDVMLAAQARSRGLILVTNNIREFDRVEGLRLENLAPGASLSWEVLWSGVALDASADVSAGSSDLVSAAQALLAP